MFEQFTIGVEEEYQIVDPETRELRSHISVMLDEGKVVLGERVKPEMHQSVVEVGTGICKNVQQARAEVSDLRRIVSDLARKNGLRIAAAGTHPFSDWSRQDITPHERYIHLVEDLQDVARGNLIFGMHVHIGIESHTQAIELFNQARYFLPHLLALSCSSPFWLGRNTGLKSSRVSVFKRFPRTGIPDAFESWAAFERYVEVLVKTGCIDNGKKIWWDVRPHSFYNTIEFRVCDLPTTVDTTIAIVALVQAIVAKLYVLRLQNMQFREYPRALIEENKWRASRYGLEGKLIDFGKCEEISTKELIIELLGFVDDVVDALGSREEIEHVYRLLEKGTDADRQLKVWKESGGDCKAVVDDMIERTMLNVGPAPKAGAGVSAAKIGE
ncbi:MAG: carboxylate-amine ligase [Candidatus Sericytochromatia bacterium]|nr:carboxylate-amine ligase [Candidatus Tanganyikabacteria bacterium]